MSEAILVRFDSIPRGVIWALSPAGILGWPKAPEASGSRGTSGSGGTSGSRGTSGSEGGRLGLQASHGTRRLHKSFYKGSIWL